MRAKSSKQRCPALSFENINILIKVKTFVFEKRFFFLMLLFERKMRF